jgi:hypothetical protein
MGRKSREKRERGAAEVAEAAHRGELLRAAATRGCIFCRETDGGFTSPEHIGKWPVSV